MTGGAALLVVTLLAGQKVDKIGTTYEGKCSWFEARRPLALDPFNSEEVPCVRYCACRWAYSKLKSQLGLSTRSGTNTVKTEIRTKCVVRVRNPINGKMVVLHPIDAGPYAGDRAIDLDPLSLRALGAKTDDMLQFTLLKRGN